MFSDVLKSPSESEKYLNVLDRRNQTSVTHTQLCRRLEAPGHIINHETPKSMAKLLVCKLHCG